MQAYPDVAPIFGNIIEEFLPLFPEDVRENAAVLATVLKEGYKRRHGVGRPEKHDHKVRLALCAMLLSGGKANKEKAVQAANFALDGKPLVAKTFGNRCAAMSASYKHHMNYKMMKDVGKIFVNFLNVWVEQKSYVVHMMQHRLLEH